MTTGTTVSVWDGAMRARAPVCLMVARTVMGMVTGPAVTATSHSDGGGNIVGGTPCDAKTTAVRRSGKGIVWGIRCAIRH
jgi:hypothetical protein